MSITIHDKIEQFGNRINGGIDEQFEQKREELIEKYKIELEKHKEQIDAQKKEMLDASVSRAERERVKLLAKAQNQEQHALLNQKQEFLQQIMKRLYDLASEFTNTSDYQSYMAKNIIKAAGAFKDSHNLTIYVMNKDVELCRRIIEGDAKAAFGDKKYEVSPSAFNIIGGLIAEDMKNSVQLDFTLKALIEENRDIIGAAITRRFNEVSSL